MRVRVDAPRHDIFSGRVDGPIPGAPRRRVGAEDGSDLPIDDGHIGRISIDRRDYGAASNQRSAHAGDDTPA